MNDQPPKRRRIKISRSPEAANAKEGEVVLVLLRRPTPSEADQMRRVAEIWAQVVNWCGFRPDLAASGDAEVVGLTEDAKFFKIVLHDCQKVDQLGVFVLLTMLDGNHLLDLVDEMILRPYGGSPGSA